MAQCSADFQTGVNAAAVLVADAGSATAWNVKSVAGGNTIIYDNTHSQGTLAGLFNNSGNNASDCTMQWTTALGTITEAYNRFYVYITAYPGAASTYRLLVDSAGANGRRILINTAGTISAQDSGGAVFTTTTAVALNQWVRIEYHIIYSATVGFHELKLFNTATSTTPDETKTSAANRNTGASATAFNVGLTAGGTASTSLWLDNIIVGAAAYPGPIIANTVAPGVTGSAPVGSTLTCDGGTWNVTPASTSYQWTRDGSNIAAATSSTYVTVGADAGHAIGCTVSTVGAASNETASQASSNTVTATSTSTFNPALSCSGSGAFLRLKGFL